MMPFAYCVHPQRPSQRVELWLRHGRRVAPSTPFRSVRGQRGFHRLLNSRLRIYVDHSLWRRRMRAASAETCRLRGPNRLLATRAMYCIAGGTQSYNLNNSGHVCRDFSQNNHRTFRESTLLKYSRDLPITNPPQTQVGR